jgi:hypothetical protein
MGTTSASNGNAPGGTPDREPRPIYLRAYAEREIVAKPNTKSPPNQPSFLTLIFDCETTDDEAQRLRFGGYQVRFGGVLREKGLFYDPDAVDDSELTALQTERERGVELRTVQSFVEEIFYDIGYAADATIVGFNLPFDISRLALGYESAKAVRRKDGSVDRSMVGGFTFKLSTLAGRPNVRVKHLSPKAAFINFAAADHNPTGEKVSRGHFLDLKTLSAALTSKSFTLDRLARHLGMPPKKPFSDFGRKIDAEFMAYAMQDVQTTWRCCNALIDQYDEHGLWRTDATKLYSEASLGKAYLKAMGVKPWLAVEKDYSARTIGRIMSAYYGGRAEVHRRREVVETRYCDFASMYPTTCSLMDLWTFVRSEGVTEHDATNDVRRLLSNLTVDQLRDPQFWLRLRVIVQVRPDADIFPVRSRYGEGPAQTIGVNYLSADRTLWFTLADCIASALLAGKPPEVVSAIRFEPKALQEGLKIVSVAGTRQTVDPRTDDFYRKVINIRRGVKSELKRAKQRGTAKAELDRLDTEQLALKILANATSYGVFIELNVESTDDGGADVAVHGADDQFGAHVAKIERPGTHFHPLLATLITGAARLMLALTERLALDEGLDWLFCDTDSMAFAKPAGMCPTAFAEKVGRVCAWFETLNPYDAKGSILEMEDQNYAVEKGPSGERIEQALFGFAVSAKRYALFNLGDDGSIVIRKASAHGLGFLFPPYREAPPPDAEDGEAPVRESGVALWQEDVWTAIIRAARDGHPKRVGFDWRPDLANSAASQHTASSPDLLRGLVNFNNRKPYAEQAKPFGFMLWFYGKRREDRVGDSSAGVLWNRRERESKPASPYRRNPADVPDELIRDRDAGDPVPRSALRSYTDMLRAYHRSPETKFIGGGGNDIGPLRRRHVFAGLIYYIGKEADAFEQAGEFGEDEDHITEYGSPPIDRATMVTVIAAAPVAKLKVKAKVGHALIAKAAANYPSVSDRLMLNLYRAALALEIERREAEDVVAELFDWAKTWTEAHTVAELANRLGDDPSNLAAAFRDGKFGKALAGRVRIFKEGWSCEP